MPLEAIDTPSKFQAMHASRGPRPAGGALAQCASPALGARSHRARADGGSPRHAIDTRLAHGIVSARPARPRFNAATLRTPPGLDRPARSGSLVSFALAAGDTRKRFARPGDAARIHRGEISMSNEQVLE